MIRGVDEFIHIADSIPLRMSADSTKERFSINSFLSCNKDRKPFVGELTCLCEIVYCSVYCIPTLYNYIHFKFETAVNQLGGKIAQSPDATVTHMITGKV